eukprot:14797845-Ditylum_brightwellii.AAC.1
MPDVALSPPTSSQSKSCNPGPTSLGHPPQPTGPGPSGLSDPGPPQVPVPQCVPPARLAPEPPPTVCLTAAQLTQHLQPSVSSLNARSPPIWVIKAGPWNLDKWRAAYVQRRAMGRVRSFHPKHILNFKSNEHFGDTLWSKRDSYQALLGFQ